MVSTSDIEIGELHPQNCDCEYCVEYRSNATQDYDEQIDFPQEIVIPMVYFYKEKQYYEIIIKRENLTGKLSLFTTLIVGDNEVFERGLVAEQLARHIIDLAQGKFA